MSTDADTSTSSATWQRRPLLWFAAVLIALALLAAVLLGVLRGCTPTASGLAPTLPSPTPVPQVIPAVPDVVTFAELNDDPFQFLNRRIRVSGDLTFPDQPDCSPYSGPQFRWALIADQLQLDARNFPQVMRQVAPSTPLTIEGIWRLYQGPLGCGKGAPRSSAWYLDVQRIIQPNPLYSTNGVVIAIENGVPSLPDGAPVEGELPAEDAPTAVPDLPATTPTFTPTAEPTSTIDPLVTPSITPSPEATPTNGVTPTTFPTATATPPPAGSTPTATPPAQATAVPTSTTSATQPTLTPEPPPVATATPGSGYPIPDTPEPQPSPTSKYP